MPLTQSTDRSMCIRLPEREYRALDRLSTTRQVSKNAVVIEALRQLLQPAQDEARDVLKT